MEYDFKSIEPRWQKFWKENQTFASSIDHSKPKYYVLDMFPYPSGAGLHVGHPLGYIASDIIARYKRNKGFNVLHPMGYDAFGLPAEQYAIQTGQHPAITTENNIRRYREQLDSMGFGFDWEREVRTSDPAFYKWTQWIFIQLFNSWYDMNMGKARPIEDLLKEFTENGNAKVHAACSAVDPFSAEKWNAMSEKEQQEILLNFRLAYLSETYVNWCPALGTVLANEEVKDGLSERGSHPVERKLMRQWSLRISAYADRLLSGLSEIDWPEPLKEAQRNWIGKSEGALINFELKSHKNKSIKVFTTRPDTIFGVSFMVIAPEHELTFEITTDDRKSEVMSYVKSAMARSERDRISEVKKVSGVFTGAYAIHPFSKEEIPVWVADYVLAGYGTGAIMAVPAGDQRDFDFAKQFDIPIPAIFKDIDLSEKACDSKDAVLKNSDFLNDLNGHDAIEKVVKEIKARSIGEGRVNFRLRDAIFSRQRYWGEPFPVYYIDELPYVMDESQLPLLLPEVDKYLPTESGEPPLARAKDWHTEEGYPIETGTMPGWAGSSWYFLRYMDAQNNEALVGDEAADYWKDVDLYIGGSEHATGHLLYFRFWTKFLCDRAYIGIDEPTKKLVNQGMIQGSSSLVYKLKDENKFVSFHLKDQYQTTTIHVDVRLVVNNVLDLEGFKMWRPEFADARFILEDGKYICGSEVEKMSKRWHNVVNPEDIIEQYGADTLRLYEMFLGPLEMSKPWNTNGIDGVHKFLRKLWRLFHNEKNEFVIGEDKALPAEQKILHKTIKKFEEDIERLSFNTTVSAFMICVNELTELKCNKKEILEPLVVMLASYAPHISEELWEKLGRKGSIADASFPEFEASWLVEDHFEYPISVNGKLRFRLRLPLGLDREQVEAEVLKTEELHKWLNADRKIKKIVVVPGRIVNVVV